MESNLEDVQRRFSAVADRLRTGGVPMSQPGDSEKKLNLDAVGRLEQIEAALRPSGPMWVRSGTTTGTGGTYAAADSYRVPFVGKSITLAILDRYGAFVQLASPEYPEWASDELPLIGPVAYSLPITTQSVRVRARSDLLSATQTSYTLIVTDTARPIGVTLLNDAAADAAEVVAESVEAALLATVVGSLATMREMIADQVLAQHQIVLALKVLSDHQFGIADSEAAWAGLHS